MATNAARSVELNHFTRERHHYDPCIVVIFGGAGDLSHRKLIPALYNLSLDGELPEKFSILGFSMESLDDEKYRAFARSGIEQFSRRPIDEDHWAKFAPLLHFNSGSFTDAADYENLRKRLEDLDNQHGTGGNRVYYFAIPPAFIDTCYQSLGRDASGKSNSTVGPTVTLCMFGSNADAQQNCIIGAVKDFISYYHSDTQADVLCRVLPGSLQNICQQTKIAYYRTF